MEKIKQKLNEFLKEFKSSQIQTSNDAMNRFAELFENEYIVENINDEHPYYKSYTIRYYIKNGYGIGIEKVWGPGDIAGGGLSSHQGIDVYIFSKLSDTYITLFDESKRNEEVGNIESLYDFDLSVKNILKIKDDFVFKCLPDNIKNKDEIILKRYKDLKIDAEIKYDNDIEDDLISYYGGLDVTINSVEYYLYESLIKHIEDSYFMEKIVPLFVKDFPNYIDEQIDRCEHAIYMIENKNEFYKWVDLDESIFLIYSDFNHLEISKDNYLKDKSDMQIKLSDSLAEYKTLSDKKYNVLDLIMGKKKDDMIKLKNIQAKIDSIKLSLKEIDNKLNELELDYNELKNEECNYEKEKLELSSKLERKFEDFTLNPDLDDRPYINDKYYLKVSLDRLIKQEYEYKEKLIELKQMKNYMLKDSKNIVEEINKTEDKDYDFNDY